MLHEWHRDKSDFAALITRGLRIFAIPIVIVPVGLL